MPAVLLPSSSRQRARAQAFARHDGDRLKQWEETASVKSGPPTKVFHFHHSDPFPHTGLAVHAHASAPAIREDLSFACIEANPLRQPTATLHKNRRGFCFHCKS